MPPDFQSNRLLAQSPNCYSLDEAARLSGLSPVQIRNIARRGLINTLQRGRVDYVFSFKDVLILRRIGQWISTNLSLNSIIEQLVEIQQFVGADVALASKNIAPVGEFLALKDGEIWRHISTGQTFLNFDPQTSDAAAEISILPASESKSNLQVGSANFNVNAIADSLSKDDLSSEDWFNLALQLESADSRQAAQQVYRKAIELDQYNVDAYINLGRLLQLEDKLREAKKLYEKVLTISPTSELACYNLGTIFDILDEFDLAIRYYNRAPNLAMAHHNLARIYEQQGYQVKAIHHLVRCRELEQNR